MSNIIETFSDLKKAYNENKTINKIVVLKGEEITEHLDFSDCTFEKDVCFEEVTFKDEVKFSNCVFKGKANFSEVNFKADTYFDNTKFFELATFKNTECKESSIDFSNIKFDSIELSKAIFTHANFLNMKDTSNRQLEKSNFISKESIVVIKKTLFELGNKREAYDYFVIEQEYTIYELKRNNSNLWIFFKFSPLLLDKYISHFGTQWYRVFLWMVIFAFLSTLSYFFLYSCDGDFFNTMVKLIFPLKLFGIESKSIENIDLWFISVVRIISAYLVWQFVRAFRIDTKIF